MDGRSVPSIGREVGGADVALEHRERHQRAAADQQDQRREPDQDAPHPVRSLRRRVRATAWLRGDVGWLTPQMVARRWALVPWMVCLSGPGRHRSPPPSSGRWPAPRPGRAAPTVSRVKLVRPLEGRVLVATVRQREPTCCSSRNRVPRATGLTVSGHDAGPAWTGSRGSTSISTGRDTVDSHPGRAGVPGRDGQGAGRHGPSARCDRRSRCAGSGSAATATAPPCCTSPPAHAPAPCRRR